jgi:uncharacterized protein
MRAAGTRVTMPYSLSLRSVIACAATLLIGLTPLAAAPNDKRPGLNPAPTIAVRQVYAPRPAIWKLTDEDTTIYLFGTTHALPKGFKWRSKAVNAAIQSARELVLETVDSPEEDKATAAMMLKLLDPTAKRPPLLERIAPDKREALRKAASGASMPLSFFDTLPTWMATFALSIDEMQQAGQTDDYGVEHVLETIFRKTKRPISAVEDGNAILAELHALPEAVQVKMLEESLTEMSEDAAGPTAADDHAWASGDVAALDKEFVESEFGPELYDLLIRRRNTAWIKWLTARMDRPGAVLFAVGAGHFAGPDSVIKMLSAKGLTVQRIE